MTLQELAEALSLAVLCVQVRSQWWQLMAL